MLDPARFRAATQPGVVESVRVLHLDHVGAEIGERGGEHRRRPHPAEIEHSCPGQRPCDRRPRPGAVGATRTSGGPASWRFRPAERPAASAGCRLRAPPMPSARGECQAVPACRLEQLGARVGGSSSARAARPARPRARRRCGAGLRSARHVPRRAILQPAGFAPSRDGSGRSGTRRRRWPAESRMDTGPRTGQRGGVPAPRDPVGLEDECVDASECGEHLRGRHRQRARGP